MEDWKLEIKKVGGGFILKGDFDQNDTSKEIVVSRDAELAEMVDLLYEVKDYFAMSYNKHNKRNIIIDIEEKETNE